MPDVFIPVGDPIVQVDADAGQLVVLFGDREVVLDQEAASHLLHQLSTGIFQLRQHESHCFGR